MQISLARPTIPVYSAAKCRTVEATAGDIGYLLRHDRIARIVRRRDGKLVRVYLKAMPGECCSSPTAEDSTTTTQDLPGTYSHHAERSAAYAAHRAKPGLDARKAAPAGVVAASAPSPHRGRGAGRDEAFGRRGQSRGSSLAGGRGRVGDLPEKTSHEVENRV